MMLPSYNVNIKKCLNKETNKNMGLVEIIGISIGGLLIVLIISIGVLIFLQTNKLKEAENKIEAKESEGFKLREENIVLINERTKKDQEIADLKHKLNSVSTEKNTLFGENNQLKERVNALQNDHKIIISENDTLKKQVNVYDLQKDSYEKQINERITQLDNAKIVLEQERARIIKDDEEKKKQELEKLDSMWNEHENNVISCLKDLCKSPELSFTTYDNKNLPDGWDGKLKPDFMIEFLNQYVIFDAKASKQDSLQTYINATVKSTSDKIKNNSNIYPLVFFVIPTEAIKELGKRYFYEQSVGFYIVSPEALAPILSCMKKITTYELAEHFDPQQRENLINLLAEFDYHINFRNAYDLIVTKMGLNVLQNIKKIDENTQEQITQKKDKMRMSLPGKTDMKRLMNSSERQEEEIAKLSTPKAEIEARDITNAKILISQNEDSH